MAFQARVRNKPASVPGQRGLLLDHPLLPALTTLLAAFGLVVVRWQQWAQGQIGNFIMVGTRFVTDPRQIPSSIPIQPTYGYDGQFYYRLALNPFNMHQVAYGIRMDRTYRFMRIGYPMLAWLASAGQRAVLPVALIGINLVALAALAYLGGIIARDGGRHAQWGLLVPAFSGLLTSLARDTAEPVSCALLLGGLLAYRRERPVLAGVLLACATLTRETTLVAVLALAAVRLWSVVFRDEPDGQLGLGSRLGSWPGSRLRLGSLRLRLGSLRLRFGRADLAWVIPSAAFGAWLSVIYALTGSVPLGADEGRNAGFPMRAAVRAILDNLKNIDLRVFTPTDIWLLELATLLAVACAALACWPRSRAPLHEKLALFGYLAEILIVSPNTWDSLTADLRSFVEVYLLAIVIMLGVPPSSRRWIPFLLPTAALCVVPALLVVAMRRILGG